MAPIEIARIALDVVGALLEVIRAVEEASRGEDPARVREVLSGELLTSARRAHAELEASLRFGQQR
jgi:hypothetical protein